MNGKLGVDPGDEQKLTRKLQNINKENQVSFTEKILKAERREKA